MREPSHQYLNRLTNTDLKLLAKLLSFDPHQLPSSWLQQQSRFISTLPSHLLRSKSPFSRAAIFILSVTDRCHLCKAHKSLDPLLIRRIFLQIVAECSTRLQRLEHSPNLPASVLKHVKSMQTLHGLWMSPEAYQMAYNASHSDPAYEQIPSGCEACVLATIGGNHQILSDLRASMIGRHKNRPPRPRLLPLIEAWIEWTDRKDIIISESQALGTDIREIRREMQLSRRQNRYPFARMQLDSRWEHDRTTPWVENLVDTHAAEVVMEDEGQTAEDFENSIIDFYANLASRTSLPPSPRPAQRMHTAPRVSPAAWASDQAMVSFQPNGGSLTRPRNTTYTESLYSRSESGRTHAQSRTAIELSRDRLGRREQADKKLLGVEDGDAPTGRSRNKRSTAR